MRETGPVLPRMDFRLIAAAGVLLLAGGLRAYGLHDSGAIYQDDLRAYSGPMIATAITARSTPLLERVSQAYRVSVEETGARPALAWLTAIPAFLGFTAIGYLYIPFALCSVGTVLLIWILCRRWFDESVAIVAALWFATSAAAVNYARSALPPTPGTMLLLLGLFVLFPRSSSGFGSMATRRRAWGAGICFALATAFHPAYAIYLIVPCLLLLMGQVPRLSTSRLLGDMIQRYAAVILPTPMMIVVYDSPGAILHMLRGGAVISELVYINGLLSLVRSPYVYAGQHEGFAFWIRYLAAAEGKFGLALISFAFVLTVWAVAKARHNRDPGGWLLVWLFTPWLVLAAWPSVTSLGRLYAPILPAVACIVGYGFVRGPLISKLRRQLLRDLAFAAFLLAVATVGLRASWGIITTPGRDPAVAKRMKATGLKSVIAFVRTDSRSLLGIDTISVYGPADIERELCLGSAQFILLSPPSFYLVLRHQDYLFDSLRIEPAITYPNPYRVPARLMEGTTPQERRAVMKSNRFTELGLFRLPAALACIHP